MPLLWNAVINLNIVKQFNHILTNEFFQRKCIETTKYMDLCSINYFLYVYRCISSEFLDFIGFDDLELAGAESLQRRKTIHTLIKQSVGKNRMQHVLYRGLPNMVMASWYSHESELLATWNDCTQWVASRKECCFRTQHEFYVTWFYLMFLIFIYYSVTYTCFLHCIVILT